MAQQITKAVAAATWTQLTNADATSVSFQVLGNDRVHIMATAGATPPSSTAGALVYQPGQGEIGMALTDYFPGVSSPTRVYAYCDDNTNIVFGQA